MYAEDLNDGPNEEGIATFPDARIPRTRNAIALKRRPNEEGIIKDL